MGNQKFDVLLEQKKEKELKETRQALLDFEARLFKGLNKKEWETSIRQYNALKVKLCQLEGTRSGAPQGVTDHII